MIAGRGRKRRREGGRKEGKRNEEGKRIRDKEKEGEMEERTLFIEKCAYICHIHSIERKKMQSLSPVQLFVTPWTVAFHALTCMGFSRQQYWSGLPFPPPGDLPKPGIEPRTPALQVDALPSQPRFFYKHSSKGFQCKQSNGQMLPRSRSVEPGYHQFSSISCLRLFATP